MREFFFSVVLDNILINAICRCLSVMSLSWYMHLSSKHKMFACKLCHELSFNLQVLKENGNISNLLPQDILEMQLVHLKQFLSI